MNAPEAPRDTLVETLERLRRVELTTIEWDQVNDAVSDALTELASGRTDRLESLATVLANTMFRARVRDRLGPSREAPAVVATKPSRALPAVGLVCAVTLMGLGWAIGGPVVLIGTGGFAVFIFVVAMAGTRSGAARRVQSRPMAHRELVTPPPTEIRETLARLESALSDAC